MIKKQEYELETKDKRTHKVKEVVQKNNIEYITSEEEQWEINNKLLLESYEEEDENTIEICSNNSVTHKLLRK